VRDFLESATDGGERLAFAALAPDPSSLGCAPARRLMDLTLLLGEAGSFHDICEAGLAVDDSFEAMAQRIIERCDAMADL
jgi:hypothetical protein